MLQFKDKIKKLRKEKDMTQEQLAEYMGVSPQAVSRWETGATCPDIFALPSLAELFGISIDELLGVDEKEKQKDIRSIISVAEEKLNKGIIDEPIVELRNALNKYPNNEQLLCSLMYALYVACEDEELCKAYDGEIVSIANRIEQHSTDSDSRNTARSILFRHYCDTNRKAEALQIADGMARIETCLERNIYWALDGDDRIAYLKERMSDDLHYLLWDISAYSCHASISDDEKERLNCMSQKIKNMIKENLNVE